MVRMDNKPDSDRPHFYSQFWIDVALGKPSAPAAPAQTSDEDEEDDELAMAAPRAEARPKPSKPVEEKKPEAGRTPLTSFADLANIDMLMRNSAEMDDTVTPDITAGISEEVPASVAGLDYDVETDAPADSDETALASQDEDFYDYDEEEDEDDDWGGSRRKKPGKQQQQRRREQQHRDY